NLRHHALIVNRYHTQGACQEGNPKKHHPQEDSHHYQGLPSIVRFRLLESWDTIADRFDPCHGGTPRRKGAQDEQRSQHFGATYIGRERRYGRSAERASSQADQSHENERQEEKKKGIRWDREHRSRLTHTTQISPDDEQNG